MAEVDFTQYLPLTFEVLGTKFSDVFGHSISGVGAYLAFFEKLFPHAETCLMSCIGDGMGKRSVTLLATIVITVFVLPIFCTLGVLYHVIAACAKAGFGLLNYLAQQREIEHEEGAEDMVEERKGDPKYMVLFKEAVKHLCFACLDLTGEFTELTFLFAGAFSFDGGQVKTRFHEMEEDILAGAPFDKMVEWSQDLCLKPAEDAGQ